MDKKDFYTKVKTEELEESIKELLTVFFEETGFIPTVNSTYVTHDNKHGTTVIQNMNINLELPSS